MCYRVNGFIDCCVALQLKLKDVWLSYQFYCYVLFVLHASTTAKIVRHCHCHTYRSYISKQILIKFVWHIGAVLWLCMAKNGYAIPHRGKKFHFHQFCCTFCTVIGTTTVFFYFSEALASALTLPISNKPSVSTQRYYLLL